MPLNVPPDHLNYYNSLNVNIAEVLSNNAQNIIALKKNSFYKHVFLCSCIGPALFWF